VGWRAALRVTLEINMIRCVWVMTFIETMGRVTIFALSVARRGTRRATLFVVRA